MKKTWWIGACLSSLLLMACGGGGSAGNDPGHASTQSNGSGVGTGGTGSYANGPITGFGSIVVNGIHFDPTTASIQDGDDPSTLLTTAALQLGMTLELTGSTVEARGDKLVANALTIHITSQLVGPVGNASATSTPDTQTLQILGQTVEVTPDTYLDSALLNGPHGLVSGQWVTVYGFFDAQSKTYIATRIAPMTNLSAKPIVQGVVSALDTVAKSCRIGTQVYQLDSIPPDLAVGKVARIKLTASTPPIGGEADPTSDPLPWAAGSITVTMPSAPSDTTAYVDGLITFVSSSSNMMLSVNGVNVDISGLSCPVCASLQTGIRVRVQGHMVNGQITADAVTVLAPN